METQVINIATLTIFQKIRFKNIKSSRNLKKGAKFLYKIKTLKTVYQGVFPAFVLVDGLGIAVHAVELWRYGLIAYAGPAGTGQLARYGRHL